MVFNSLTFLVFAILFFSFWPFFSKNNSSRWIYITVASFIFYGWWDWRFLFLLLFTGLLDFWAALMMVKFPSNKKLVLWISIVGNIGTLGFFKYFGMLSQTADVLFRYFRSPLHFPDFNILLPVGISFYTFQSLSYTIDVYRGRLKPTGNVFHFFAYLSLFTQLVAGPIARAVNLLPQLENWVPPTQEMVWDGLKLVAAGYFKKMFLADNLALAVKSGFESARVHPSGIYWWIVMAMFVVQVYADFCGYSDIARGLSKWMGYELPINFNRPFALASSLTDFWNRWHITLTRWFRDYVYQTLGGGFKRFSWKTYRNLWITMLLIGLWHGAAWTFVLCGAVNAFFLSIERLYNWPKTLGKLLPIPYVVTFLATMEFILGAVWFASKSFFQGAEITKNMILLKGNSEGLIQNLGAMPIVALLVAMACEIFIYIASSSEQAQRIYKRFEPAVVAGLIVMSVFFRGPGINFVYFQF